MSCIFLWCQMAVCPGSMAPEVVVHVSAYWIWRERACRVLLLECLLESKCETFVLTRSEGNFVRTTCQASVHGSAEDHKTQHEITLREVRFTLSPWMVLHHCIENPLPAACSTCSMQCAVPSTFIFNKSLLPPSQWQWQPAIPETWLQRLV